MFVALKYRRSIASVVSIVASFILFVWVREGQSDGKRHYDATVVKESCPPVVRTKENEDECATCNRRFVLRKENQAEMSMADVIYVPNDAPAVAKSLEDVAAERSQQMDDLLNQNPMPSDYGRVMVDLFRDKSLDAYTRDFAVQHIGLYAEALQRQGRYDPSSSEARLLRQALEEAAQEARTIVAAAAFRALSDLAAFDPNVDLKRLGSRLLSCVSDASASQAARVMAIQLCGERNITVSQFALRRLVEDPSQSVVIRKSAGRALKNFGIIPACRE